MDSTGGGKASRFPEVKSGGDAAGFLEFGWIHRWIGSWRCRRVWLVVVDFVLSSVISASLMLLSCFGGKYVVGDGSVLLCFLSYRGREKKRKMMNYGR